MNLKKIIVFQDEILFNILNEIKEKINFDLIKISKEDLEQSKIKLTEDCLVISTLIDKNLKHSLILNEAPIKLVRLVELINLKFLKEKFIFQSDILVGAYKLNLNSREISKNNKTLNLTEREINLIVYLKKAKSPIKINVLQKEVWDYGDQLETHTVETHIYRLRKKIKEKFDDDEFIISSKEGYLLN